MTILLNITRCADGDDADYTPTYPIDAEVFTIENEPDGVSINATTGAVTIGPVILGEYSMIVKYRVPIGEGYVYYEDIINLLVIDCTPTINKSYFTICRGGTLSIQISSAGVIGAITSAYGWATDQGGGELEIVTGSMTIGEEYDFTVDIDGTEVGFTVKAILCDATTYVSVAECERDALQIVWKNRAGGWNNYWLNQNKLFSVEQAGGKSYININDEELWTSRGNIYDFIDINQNQIPKGHVSLLRSLRDSIQAYLATDLSDPTTFLPIKLDEGSFNLYESDQEYYSLYCRFKYSKRRKVQQQ